MFAIDTNLLVYAHNTASPFNKSARVFVERAMNERDDAGDLSVCLAAQILLEFVHVITWQRLNAPLSLSKALRIIQDYLDTGITIVHQRNTQIQTFLELAHSVTTRKRVFDVALAATLKDNRVSGLYTVNVADFERFDFLQVVNPLQEDNNQA